MLGLTVLVFHPIAEGLPAAFDFLDSSTSVQSFSGSSFGSADPAKVASTSSGDFSLFAYEQGESLAGGGSAVSRRAAIGGLTGSAVPSSQGWDLIDNMVGWATESSSASSAPAPSTGGWTPGGEIYTYDNRGNRLTAGTDSFSYDGRNRLRSDPDGTYEWHPDGTLDTYTPVSGAVEVYDFDAAGRVVGVSSGSEGTTYSYDALDRIASRDGTGFAYSGTQLDPASDGEHAFHRDIGGGLLAYETSSGVRHAVLNGHNDLVGLASGSGELLGGAGFDPWGEPTWASGDDDLVLGYQGDYTDPGTDQVWMGARWYQPSSATFLSRDTYSGELTTPFSLNRYTYALNNPLRYWDPDGRRASVDGLGFGEHFATKAKAKPERNDGTGPQTYDYSTNSWSPKKPPPKVTYTPNPIDEITTINELAKAAQDRVVSGNVDKIVAMVDSGQLPPEALGADLGFLLDLRPGYVDAFVDHALAGVPWDHDGVWDEASTAAVLRGLWDSSNTFRCDRGIGTCYEAQDWASVAELGVAVLLGAGCGAGAAATVGTSGVAGVGAAVACGAAAAVGGGVAGN